MRSSMVENFKCSEIELKSEEKVSWTRDGEYAGAHKSVKLKNYYRRLKILVPETFAAQQSLLEYRA